MFHWLTERRRRHLIEQPFPDAWRGILEANVAATVLGGGPKLSGDRRVEIRKHHAVERDRVDLDGMHEDELASHQCGGIGCGP